MRKICVTFFSVLLAFIMLLSNPVSIYSSSINSSFSIEVNGVKVNSDVPPIIKNDRIFVPLRAVTEMLGGTTEWDEKNQLIYITYKDLKITMGIGSKLVITNNVWSYMDVEPFLYNDRTLVPIRFAAESMGLQVNWFPVERLASINDPDNLNRQNVSMILGYTTNDYSGDNNSYNSLVTNYKNMNAAATFSHVVESDGTIRLSGQSQANAVSFSNNNGIKPLMLVHNMRNGQFDINLAHDVLSNENSRKNMVENILKLLKDGNYSGVNIDIEHIYWYDRPYYTALIKELKEALAPYGLMTTAAIMAKTYDSYENNNWGGAFDYKEIGKYADRILLMTYDEHYFGGPSGPIASLPWVESVLKYATANIPSDKLLLGIGGYGYDWSALGTKAVSMKNIDSLITNTGAAPVWNSDFKSPYFIYYKNGVKHEVWYENAESISYKLDLIKKYNLGGIGLWKLGYENAEFWRLVSQKLSIIN